MYQQYDNTPYKTIRDYTTIQNIGEFARQNIREFARQNIGEFVRQNIGEVAIVGRLLLCYINFNRVANAGNKS